jgi:2-phosphosulfolactate phosphatase
LATCHTVTGPAVVIDVLRAFTSAAYACAAGAEAIYLVGEVAQAFALRSRIPDALLMGEVGGAPIAGFDFSNSPGPYLGRDLSGRRLIQRTSHGTQGIVRATQAGPLLAASFACAEATVRWLQHHAADTVTFVITGWEVEPAVGDLWGDEDAACAGYLEARLQGHAPDPAPYLARVYASPTGRLFGDPAYPHYPAADLDYCTRLDVVDFALPVQREGELYVLRPDSGLRGD